MALTPSEHPSIRERALAASRKGGCTGVAVRRPVAVAFDHQGEAAGGGLVYSSTSDTQPAQAGELYSPNPHQSRLRRLRKSVLNSARLIQDEVDSDRSTRYRAYMVTLTYRIEDDWCPLQITAYLKRVRQHFLRRKVLIRYLWVHELTKAGKTHYHVLLWLPKACRLPKADTCGWWPHGMTKTEKVERNAVGYVAKYASKGTDDKVPKGARLSGSGGLSLDGRSQRAWWMCPGYIRAWCPDYSDRPRRASGGGWLAKDTGEYLPSQFEIVRKHPLMVRRKPLDVPPEQWPALLACSCIHTRQLYSGFTL